MCLKITRVSFPVWSLPRLMKDLKWEISRQAGRNLRNRAVACQKEGVQQHHDKPVCLEAYAPRYLNHSSQATVESRLLPFGPNLQAAL